MITVPHIGPIVVVPSPTMSDPIDAYRYANVTFAVWYFNEHKLNTEAWDDAEGSARRKSLTEATAIMDRLSYYGSKTVDTQLLEFPRDGDTTVPSEIKAACCEIAYALLDGVDPEIEYENLSMSEQAFGSTKAKYNTERFPINFAHGVPSFRAWTYLSPYLASDPSIILDRVS